MPPRTVRSPRRVLAALLLAALTSVACGPSGSAPSGPEPLAPLAAATWVMVEADGQALPAVVAHRILAGNVLEQSVLESAQLHVGADGSYEQQFRIRTLENGVERSNVLVQDIGAWTAGTERYDLASDTRVRSFRIDPVVAGTLSTVEAMVFRPEAGLVRGRYVLLPPA